VTQTITLRSWLVRKLVIPVIVVVAVGLGVARYSVADVERERPYRVTLIVSYVPGDRYPFITWYAGKRFDELKAKTLSQWDLTIFADAGDAVQLAAGSPHITGMGRLRCTIKVDWQHVPGSPDEDVDSCQVRYVIPHVRRAF